MISPILGHATTLINTGTRFYPPDADFGAGWATTETSARTIMATSGTLQNWYVSLVTAPGAGTSYTFTILKNGVAQSMAITVSNTATTGNDTVNTVTYSAGDAITVQSAVSGSPATGHMGWTMENSCTGQSLGFNDPSVASNTVSSYTPVQGDTWATSATGQDCIIPTAGTISNLYLQTSAAPGAAKSWTVTLVLNGVDQTLTAQVAGVGVTTANDTTHTITVAAGDKVYWRVDPVGTPTTARVHGGAMFTPTTDGESIQTFASNTSMPTGGANSFMGIGGGGSPANSTTESSREMYIDTGTPFDLKKLYVALSGGNTGIGTTWTFTVRLNLANTTLSAQVTGGNSTANDTTHIPTISSSGWLGVNVVAGSGPLANQGAWGFVTYRSTGSVLTATQTGTARISATVTKTQTATARISKAITKTQSAIARISNTGMTKTQSSISRISKSITFTQAATARISTTQTKTQSATANISTASVLTKTQSAVARISAVVTKTQTSVARISKTLTATQSATARISLAVSKTQAATARISKAITKTQSATARLSLQVTKTQSAIARISGGTGVVTKTQTAKAAIYNPNYTSQASPIIFLTNGRMGLRLGGNIYMPV